MAYLHGAYGEIGESKVASVTQADVVAAYIGTAPVNLIRGYADKDLVNMPVKVTNMSEVQSLVGYSDAGKHSPSVLRSLSTSTTPSEMWARSIS